MNKFNYEDIIVHEKNCQQKPINCEFKILGCDWEGEKKDLEAHRQDCEFYSKQAHELQVGVDFIH